MICTKMKWSTISISTALVLIIVYASSGLYTLIDVTTLISMQSNNSSNETSFWPMLGSQLTIILGSTSLAVYFAIVLLVIILLCGIQWNKPWLLFLWSILMIVMLLADGIVTVLSLRHYQQQVYGTAMKVKILFIVMIIRLIISLCGIFVTVFHFRQLNKAQSDCVNRQRMLVRYNTESASPSYEGSWARSGNLLDPSKDSSDDRFTSDLPAPMVLPRAKVATIQRRPISSMFQTRNSSHPPPEYLDHPHQLPVDDYQEDGRYNIPLQDRFLHSKATNVQEM